MVKFYAFVRSVFFSSLLLGACSSIFPQSQSTPNQTEPAISIANPASVNCIEKGGILTIQKRGDGGEYGICSFGQDRQCEEWAMMRGECPGGGIDIAGYITQAAQYCVITGGDYSAKGEIGKENEQGICLYTNGKSCDVWELFNGQCSPNE